MKKYLSIGVVTMFVLASFFVANIAKSQSIPSVIISEFVSDPSVGNEWVELLNNTDEPIDLTGWKLTELTSPNVTPPSLPTEVDLLSLSGMLPARGILVFNVGSSNLNNDGDSIGLFNDTTEINRVNYGDVSIMYSPNYLPTAPSTGLSGRIENYSAPTTWSSGTPTKGWFNNATDWTHEQLAGDGSPSVPPTLTSVASDLSSGNGVVTNMGSVDDPSSATNLYFEKRTNIADPSTTLGKIFFVGPLNLTDQNTVNYLKSIGNKLDIQGNGTAYAKIGLNTYVSGTTESVFKNLPATITMYGLSGLSNAPDLIVKNNSDIVIPPDDPDYPSIGAFGLGLGFDSTAHTFTFTTDHFTTFETKISVTGITVNSPSTSVMNTATLAMSAGVLPSDATDSSVTWSVAPLVDGTATIDATTGVLTATGVGTVTVTATANDGSGITGTKDITITEVKKVINATTGVGYGTIQEAITAASTGDTINVAAGTYTENITIDKSLSLIGEASTTTIIDGGESGVVVTISASSVTFSGFTVQKSGTDITQHAGIVLAGVSDCTIENNIVGNNAMGIAIVSSSGNTVQNNEIKNSARYGIVLDEHPLMSGEYSTSNTISGNIITDNARDGIYIGENCNTNAITDNSISGATGTMEGTDYEGNGIYFWKSGSHTVTGNTISNNVRYGIELMGSSDNVFTDNIVTDNLNGFMIRSGVLSSTGNTITNNTISGNSNVAILLVDDYSTNNYDGVVTGNNISENNIYGNTNYNLSVMDVSPETLINATNNWWGSSDLTTITAKVSANVTFKPYYIDAGMATLSNIKAISGFSISGQVGVTAIDEDAKTITIIMPYGTDVTGLIPAIITTDGASVNPTSGSANNFTNPQTYTVHAIDETTQDYTVTVSLSAPSNIATVTSDTYNVDDTASTITNVPFGIASSTFLANLTKGESNQVWDTSGISDTVITGNVLVVTAQDGTFKTYTLTVALNPAKTITDFNFVGYGTGTVDEGAHTIAVTVPYRTNVTALIATFTTTGSSVAVGTTTQISNTTANDFTNPVTYIVTAADSSTQNYVVTVTVAANPAKAITAFSFSGLGTGIIDEEAHTIAVTVPYGTDVTDLVANFTITGDRVIAGAAIPQTSGSNHNNFTDPFTYTVIAADNSSQDYVVTVTVALNSAKAITAFNFSTGTGVINEASSTISVNVPFGTNVSSLIPTITITGASVNPASRASNDFSTTTNYTVTAANGDTKDYTVTVSILADNQIAPDENGDVTASSTSPEVVITNPTQGVTVTVATGTDAKIDVSSFITDGEGDIPQITIDSGVADIIIPATTVTSADATWNGVIAAPTVTTVTLPETSGQTKTLSTAIEIGFTGAKLSFDNAVKVTMPGQADKRVGYSRTGTSFTEITTACTENTQTWADANLGVDGDCKIDVGSDLVIWTKHFTTFATYTQVTTTSTGGAGGGGVTVVTIAGTSGGTSETTVSTPTVVALGTTPTTVVTPISAPTGQVLGVSTFNFNTDLRLKMSNSDVTELQTRLTTEGVYSGPITGYFGSLTLTAVKAYQAKKGISQTGFVGPLTRAALNNSSTSSNTDISSAQAKQMIEALIQAGIISSDKIESARFIANLL